GNFVIKFFDFFVSVFRMKKFRNSVHPYISGGSRFDDFIGKAWVAHIAKSNVVFAEFIPHIFSPPTYITELNGIFKAWFYGIYDEIQILFAKFKFRRKLPEHARQFCFKPVLY